MDQKREIAIPENRGNGSVLARPSGELVEDKIQTTKPTVELPNAKNLYSLAVSFAKSGMFPHAKNPFGIMTIIEYGRELGIPPVSALQTMSLVNGRLAIESKALFAIALKHGITIEVIEKTKERCVLRFTRPGHKPYTETFTIEDARRIGLTEKDNWKKYPEEMLYWRCGAKGLRAYCSDLLLALYTKEELEDIAMAPSPTHSSRTAPQATPVVDVDLIDVVPTAEPEPPTPPTPEQPPATNNDFQLTPPPAEEPATPPAPQETSEKPAEKDDLLEASIALINGKIERAGINRQQFLKWLYTIQGTKRVYVGKLYNNYSLHHGDRDDVVELARTIDRAINTYLAQTKAKGVSNGKQ